MKACPLFSVIIPTFNRADFIGKTVESVLRQTFTDFEIIVIDDGSTDNTAEIIAPIKDERLTYHFKQHEERAAARNAGTKLARGEYVTFLDSDDLLYENHLETAVKIIEKFKKPEVFHLGYVINDLSTKTVKKVDYLPEIANDVLTKGNCLSCNGVFLRKDIAEKHSFNQIQELSGTEDYELWLRLASRYPLYCDNSITSAIIQHDSRSVVNTNSEKLVKRIKLLEESLFKDKEFVEKYTAHLAEFQANNRVYIALHLALTKKYRLEAINYLLKSVSFSRKALNNRAFYGTLKRLFI